jgi:RimJ/RimL family protein N-acetyltransferase
MTPGTSWPPVLDRTSIRWEVPGLVLSPLVEEDAPELLDLALESAPEISPWMRWTETVRDLHGARDRLRDWSHQWDLGEGFYFAVRESTTRRMVGGAGLNQFNWKNRFGNLAYWVRTSARGEAIAPRVARGVAQFGFEQLGLLRVEILMEPTNTASLRVAEKAGAYREGLLRSRILNGDVSQPAVLFSLIPSDFTSAAQ